MRNLNYKADYDPFDFLLLEQLKQKERRRQSMDAIRKEKKHSKREERENADEFPMYEVSRNSLLGMKAAAFCKKQLHRRNRRRAINDDETGNYVKGRYAFASRLRETC